MRVHNSYHASITSDNFFLFFNLRTGESEIKKKKSFNQNPKSTRLQSHLEQRRLRPHHIRRFYHSSSPRNLLFLTSAAFALLSTRRLTRSPILISTFVVSLCSLKLYCTKSLLWDFYFYFLWSSPSLTILRYMASSPSPTWRWPL